MNKAEQQAFEHVCLLGEPAYGRQYSDVSEIKQDWNDNKDFRNVTPGVRGAYFNKQDAEKYNVNEVILSTRNGRISFRIKMNND